MAKKKRTRVNIEINKPELQNVDAAPDEKVIGDAIDKSSKKEVRKSLGMIISRLNKPEYVEYDGEKVMVSPRERRKVADIALIKKPLPRGILVKKLK